MGGGTSSLFKRADFESNFYCQAVALVLQSRRDRVDEMK